MGSQLVSGLFKRSLALARMVRLDIVAHKGQKQVVLF
jgi:hypothetical protein